MATNAASAEQLRSELRQVLQQFLKHSSGRASTGNADLTASSADIAQTVQPSLLNLASSMYILEGLSISKPISSYNEKYARGKGRRLRSYESHGGGKEELDEEAKLSMVARELAIIADGVNAKLASKGSSSSSFLEALSSLTGGAAATFSSAVSQWLPAELPEVQQLALLFWLADAAVRRVGGDADKAERISSLTVDYACQQYGSYIAAHGGLETVVRQ